VSGAAADEAIMGEISAVAVVDADHVLTQPVATECDPVLYYYVVCSQIRAPPKHDVIKIDDHY
jgi:hypothetical protein